MSTENKYAERFEAAKTVTELLLFRDELRNDAKRIKWNGEPDSPELAAIQNANYYKEIVHEKVSALIGNGQPVNTPALVTKREYFAAMAMQGLCANQGSYEEQSPYQKAITAIECADQILKLLNSKPD